MEEKFIKRCNNREEVEALFLESLEFDEDLDSWDEKLKDFMKNIFDMRYSPQYLTVIFIKDNKVILTSKHKLYDGIINTKFFVVENTLNFSIGDRAIIIDERKIIKIEKDVFSNIDINIYNFNNADYSYILKPRISEFFNSDRTGILTGEIINKAIEKLKVRLKETELEKKEKVEESKEREKSKILKEALYKKGKDIFFDDNGINIKRDRIEIKDYEFKLDKDVNKLFKFEFFNGSYATIYGIKSHLIKGKVSYILKNKGIREYDVNFHDGNRINGVKITYNKIQFILERMGDNPTKEQISIYNKLTGMKLDLIKLDYLNIYRSSGLRQIEIPIKISLIDIDNFKIDFLGEEKEVNWNILNEGFYKNGHVRTIRESWDMKDFIIFCMNIGFEKQEVFDYLKKVVMVKQLE